MRVVVYVEGPSDQTAMNILLRPLLDQKRQEAVVIKFVQSPEGDKKKILLTKIPRAANTLDIADKCPQCFKPFVDFLTNLQPMSYD